MSEIIAQYGTIFLAMAVIFGFFMAWGVGANDVANAMGTSVGARAITIRQAVLIAMVFEFAGAALAGGEVTETVRSGIISLENSGLEQNPELLVYGMLSSLLAAGVWLLVATQRGWPVSTTHSIVGAIVGFAVVGISLDSVNWGQVGSIAASWVVSPVFSGLIALLLFLSVQKLVLDTEDPLANARRYVPWYIFLVGFVISTMTMIKGLSRTGLEFNLAQTLFTATVIGFITMGLGILLLRRLALDVED
ncbi:MAG: inorganic phosphate transporter, partial [Gammaproteobacteria bacterium]|nr:inorganic phosphate transporter [Gammaproteobacteria bacterium]